MEIIQNYNLTKLNTFGISTNAKFFVELHDEKDLQELFKLFSLPEYQDKQKLFLGGGSNILFTKDFDGIVILNKLKGIKILNENDESVLVQAMSGVIWHDLVLYAVNKGYWGLENLSLVPGTVGAAPMQNIGAYGEELKDVLETVECFEINGDDVGKKIIFSKEECELGYRDSVFKNKFKDKYFISAINLKLSKIPKPNLSYKILKDYLENKNGSKNLKDISDVVIEIRKSKLPDPKIIGNAGSFFKNVFLEKEKLEELLKTYHDMPSFEEDSIVKIPAGWLIEQTGWKGKRLGNVGVHDKQALVIVNHGGATGAEILELANKIIESVKEKFGLELNPEVNIV